MRILKWLAVLAAIIVLIAIIVHLRRDSIAQNLANSVLEEQGLVATDLEVGSLSPSKLELDRLVIESESGARYEITGLSVPLGVASDIRTQILARSLAVSYATERDRQEMLSTTLETILNLPTTQTSFEVIVGSIELPGLPLLQGANLHVDYRGLTLGFAINELHVGALLTNDGAAGGTLDVGAVTTNGIQVLGLDLELARVDDRYVAAGGVSARIAAWLPTLKQLNLVPPGVEQLDARLEGGIDIGLDEASPGTARIGLELSAGDGATARYVTDSGRASSLVAGAVDALQIEFNYPTNDWTAQFGTFGGVFGTDGLSETPVTISDLECQSGITCTLTASTESQPVTWNDHSVAAATVSLPLVVQTGAETRVSISPDATGEFAGLSSEGIAAEEISGTGFSGTEVLITNGGWQCRIDELQLAFDNLVATDDLLVSPGVTLTELEIGDSGATLAGKVSVAAPFDGRWKDLPLSLPGATGTFAFADERLQATVDLVDLNDAIAGKVDWARDTAADSGSLAISNGWVSFDRARLSDYLPDARLPIDILQGSWDVDLSLEWTTQAGIPAYRGRSTMQLGGIGGTYTDIAMIGLTTDLDAAIDPAEGLVIKTEPVSTRLLDLGVPIENIAFEYSANLDDQKVLISGLSFDVFGGSVNVDPFEYALAAETTEVRLYARDIQLQLMVDVLEFESLALTGTISGELPVTISDKTITVSSGRMESDSAGTIRYQPSVAGPDTAAQDVGLGAILQTLNNFEYESLSATVDYTEGGDMKLLMRVVGVNPDIDPDQPYAFNLNLDNNIPEMLRSLRAVRSIEDILKQRTEN